MALALGLGGWGSLGGSGGVAVGLGARWPASRPDQPNPRLDAAGLVVVMIRMNRSKS